MEKVNFIIEYTLGEPIINIADSTEISTKSDKKFYDSERTIEMNRGIDNGIYGKFYKPIFVENYDQIVETLLNHDKGSFDNIKLYGSDYYCAGVNIKSALDLVDWLIKNKDYMPKQINLYSSTNLIDEIKIRTKLGNECIIESW